MPLVELTCQHCSAPFLVRPGRATTARFCSSRCNGVSQRSTSYVCEKCGRSKLAACFGVRPSGRRSPKCSECTAGPLSEARSSARVLRRFWRGVRRGDPDECWEWTGSRIGARINKGYGMFYDGERKVYTHRYSYEIHNGPIPLGIFVCHRCDNRPCCNPAHLFLGTNRDNVLDSLAKGRTSCYNKSDLSEAQIRTLRDRARAGESCQDLGVEFGLSRSHVWRIRSGLCWGHLA